MTCWTGICSVSILQMTCCTRDIRVQCPRAVSCDITTASTSYAVTSISPAKVRRCFKSVSLCMFLSTRRLCCQSITVCNSFVANKECAHLCPNGCTLLNMQRDTLWLETSSYCGCHQERKSPTGKHCSLCLTHADQFLFVGSYCRG